VHERVRVVGRGRVVTLDPSSSPTPRLPSGALYTPGARPVGLTGRRRRLRSRPSPGEQSAPRGWTASPTTSTRREPRTAKALSAGNVPTRESAFVRLVPRNQVAVIPEQDVVVERAAFEAIVRHAVVKQVTNDRLAELSARIQQIEEEAHAKEQPLIEERYAI